MSKMTFDPITTELVIQRVKKKAVDAGNSAKLGALVVPTSFELLVNNISIVESVEITDTGSFAIYSEGTVEIE